MFSRNINNLIEKLQHPNWRIRQKTVQNLQALSEAKQEVKSALPKLYELIKDTNQKSHVRVAALDAVVSIENNKSSFIDKLIEWLDNKNERYSIRYAAAEAFGKEKITNFLKYEPVEEINKILKQLEDRSKIEQYPISIRLGLLKTIAQIKNEDLPVAKFIDLIKNGDETTKRNAAKALGSLREKAQNTLPELENILKEEKEECVCLYIQMAIERIQGLFPTNAFLEYLKTDNKQLLKLASTELLQLSIDLNQNEVLGVLINVLKENLSDSSLSLDFLKVIIKILEKDELILVDKLVQVLDMNQTKLSTKLDKRVALELESLAPESLVLIGQKVLPKLKKVQYSSEGKPEIEITRAIRAVETALEHKQILKAEMQLKNLDTEISLQEKVDIITTLIEQACSSEPLQLLLDRWFNWIAEGKETFLIRMTADNLREQKLAVYPLINFLENLKDEWQPTEKLKKKIRQQVEQEVVKKEKRQRNKEDDVLVELKVTEQIKKRKQNIEIRIFQLLAEMSQEKFFIRYKDCPNRKKRYENIYKEIKEELSKYATPVLARRLVDESNSKICELITLILANNGGFYATNALASRTHYDRKELLTEYYLKPSKKQNENATEMLKGTVKAAKTTLVIQQSLNIIIFVVALTLLTGALFTGMHSKDNAQRIGAVFAGVGGLGGMVFHFINKPLERIQKSLTDLVQAETTFTSYIWELNLNSAFIQSQYMENGVLSNDEIDQTVERTQNVTKLTLELLDTNLEQNEQPPGRT